MGPRSPSARQLRNRGIRRLLAAGLGMALVTVAFAQSPQPEQGFGRSERPAVTGTGAMAVTAHPLATDAAASILRRGGSAADAAIAAQLMLGLVEPQSSGLGGGAFALYYDADRGRLSSYDGREIAPAAATPDRFLAADGSAMKFRAAVPGGLSVGVPGIPALLEILHRRHGKLAWLDLFADSIRRAEDGFVITPRLHASIARAAKRNLNLFDTTRHYFFDADGNARAAGSPMQNVPYADTLRAIASQGAAAFYSGDIAASIVSTVTGAAVNPGDMTREDLRNYRVIQRPPVCLRYRQYRICGMGPPSSGMLTVGQILGTLAAFPLDRIGPTPEGYHLYAESSRLAYADRAKYMADADFVAVPVAGLLDPDYLRSRAMLINREKAMDKATAGTPPGATVALAPQTGDERPGTTHLSIVDADGNIVSITSSIETGFGSRLMTNGFLLNNQLTDFSFKPVRKGERVANRVTAGKRPRSSMAPTIVFDQNDQPVLAIGSPGGSRIIAYVALSLIRILDWGMSPRDAVEAGHVTNRGGSTDIEEHSDVVALLAEPLATMGHRIKIRNLNSGIHLISFNGNEITGYADSRREGVAIHIAH